MTAFLLVSISLNLWLLITLLIRHRAYTLTQESIGYLVADDEEYAMYLENKAWTLSRIAMFMSFGLLEPEVRIIKFDATNADVDGSEDTLTIVPISHLTDEELDTIRQNMNSFAMIPRDLLPLSRILDLEDKTDKLLGGKE